MLFGFDKISLINKPTPLEFLPTISTELGIELYIKRDDMTNLGIGGNKLRKLEYILKEAQNQKATMLMTQGGIQTNHGRLTAAVASKFGMKCAILCVDDHPDELSANILLSRILGADVIIKKNDGRSTREQYKQLIFESIDKYERQGEKVYYIPLGGSNDVGFLGYYECAMETTKQAESIGLKKGRIITAVGSFGTYLGLCCGLKNENSLLNCTGIAIMPFGNHFKSDIMSYFKEVKSKYNLSIDFSADDFHIETNYTRGGYNNVSCEVRDAIYYMARKEGIFLDPCYTGKSFAGLIDMVKEGKIKSGEKIIFLHSGGFPGIYTKHHRQAFEEELMNGVCLID